MFEPSLGLGLETPRGHFCGLVLGLGFGRKALFTLLLLGSQKVLEKSCNLFWARQWPPW